MNVSTINVNPYYVAKLLGVVALARDMDKEDLFELVDYSNSDHVAKVVEELIKPEFIRMTEECRNVTKESLRYILNSSVGEVVSQLCNMIGVPEGLTSNFLNQLWQTLFPNESADLPSDCKYSLSVRPLRFDQIRFTIPPNRSLEESTEILRIGLQSIGSDSIDPANPV